MTAPGWREQAGEAFWAYLKSMGYGRSEPTRDALAAALDAAEPLIRAEADKRRIPGSEMYMAGIAAERERIWSLAVTQRLELSPDNAVWQCAGCSAPLTEGRIAHKPRCSEMRLAGLIEGDGQ